MFHIEYRPKDFNEVVGNKQTKDSLKALLNKGTLPHVLLFHGASGCGKTTFARIIANKLECSEHDYKEINAGNNRGIDTARDIIKSIQFAPLQGNVKVILIDEVHQATKDFQNSLLKALEDTPRHVYFILCTTDPQKLLLTIRNRCMMFEVKSLNDKQMIKLLINTWATCDEVTDTYIADKHIKAVEKIIDKAEGCPRQALILLEQIINLPKEQQLKAIKVFKTNDQKMYDLSKALLNKESWTNIVKLIKGIEEEPETVRRNILGLINAVMLKEENPHCMLVYMAFKDPFFNSGKAGLTFACYKAIKY